MNRANGVTLVLRTATAALVLVALAPFASAAGEAATRITTHPAEDGHPTWSPDGSQIAFVSGRSGNADIWIIPATGGDATQLTFDPAGDGTPAWSPDGSQIAFTSDRGGPGEIWVIPATGGTATRLTRGASPAWSSDASQIAFDFSVRYDHLSVHHRLARGVPGPDWPPDIKIIPATGGPVTRLTPGRDPAWSPGTQIAFDWEQDIWVIDVTGGNATRLTLSGSGGYPSESPDWSPDGDWIAFSSYRGGFYNSNIWIIPATGEPATQVTFDVAEDYSPAWSPLGDQIAFSSQRSGNFDIYVIDVEPPLSLHQESWGHVKGRFYEK